MSMVKTVHLGEKITEILENESSKEECSQSYIVRRALREYFKNNCSGEQGEDKNGD